ncbi:MAG: carboxypeptidase M32, partial [Burkholderiales bacterium]
AALREAAGLLNWDLSTVMPEGGATARGEQLAALDVTCHELLSCAQVSDLLDEAEAAAAALDPWARSNLAEMRRRWRHATALPADLVEARAKANSCCETAWRRARPAADFSAVRRELEAVLKLTREAAAAKSDALGCAPYDALLDEYEPAASAERIDALFARLSAFLPDLVLAIEERQKRAPQPLEPDGPFLRAKQEALARTLMTMLGFDFKHGRLDVSLHPFCGGVPEDVRITTRYDEADFTSALMGVLHETGHALYERGLPAEHRLQPVGEARGMALHESQSLLIEMQACRSRAFVGYLAPLAREAFGGSGPAWEADNLHRLYTRVERGFVRVDADEATYPAHVILRYRLERELVAGGLAVADLPAAWNAAMAELLGVTPPDDRLGCLQDIHWYDGAWGYFPTYTMGALAAAQLFAAARAAIPELETAICRGDFAPLLAWLRREIHGRASLLSTDALIESASGRPLGVEAFRRHLE